jgi:hypothetical protein
MMSDFAARYVTLADPLRPVPDGATAADQVAAYRGRAV